MKYIDTDKLIAEIEKRKEERQDIRDSASWKNEYWPESDFYIRDKEDMTILQIIDSLQQEQPDCHTVEDWIQHIKNADQLTKDIFSKGPYDVLYDALNHPYQHCYDAIKEFGELCFQTGVNSVKQEQPEVDLEKEIDDELDRNWRGHYIEHRRFVESAKYFYKLGLNAKNKD